MFIGGLDIGTTGCKLTVFTEDGVFVTNCYCEYKASRSASGHELDGASVWDAVKQVVKGCAAECGSIDAIGVTSFGETFVMLDENDNVLRNSFLYTDPRGDEQCAKITEDFGKENIISVCGMLPHQMYSLPKAMWVKENEPEIYAKTKRILLYEDFVVYMLSGVAQIEYSLAARTMAFDIRKKSWSSEILNAAGIDEELFSKCVLPGTVAGKIRPELASELGCGADTVIVSGAHDQVASAVGAGVLDVNLAVDGIGTVECITPVFADIPTDPDFYDKGYAVVPYALNDTYCCYVLSYAGGAATQWFKDTFKSHVCDNPFGALESEMPDDVTGLLMLPHFAGAATPYMDIESRAAFIGMSLSTTQGEIYKGLLEGISYEMRLNVEGTGFLKLDKLYATGGGSKSDKWMQIKADIMGVPYITLEAKEVGAAGTAMLTATAIGVFDSLEDAKKKFVKQKAVFTPDMKKHEEYSLHYERYLGVYKAVRPLI